MTNQPIDRERAQHLMMAAVDGEITPAERQELDTLVAGSPDLAAEWARMHRVKEVTSTMSLKPPPEEVWDRYWTDVYHRAERGAAWVLLSVGAIVLAAYAIWTAIEHLFEDTSVPVLVRFAVGAVALGFAILAVSVVREKLFTRSRDPYEREVTR